MKRLGRPAHIRAVLRGYTWVDTRIKVTRSLEVPLSVPVGTTEHVPVVDKEPAQLTLGVFLENGLPVVCVPGTNVDQPCQPESLAAADPLEAVSGKNFEQPHPIPAEEA